jgi:hypothetical protein
MVAACGCGSKKSCDPGVLRPAACGVCGRGTGQQACSPGREWVAHSCQVDPDDVDRDGFPNSACNPAMPVDCNDADPSVRPSATATCNGKDDDCDGLTDEDGAAGCTNFYVDHDGDGHGVAGDPRCLCAPIVPYLGRDTRDCDDTNSVIYPGAVPVPCSAVDNDCNGLADSDNDGDTHLDIVCPGGDDCNDADRDVWSGAWYDPTTRYLWENPPPSAEMTWDSAVNYCRRLSACGRRSGTWHLPTIDQLRSLIRGCPTTEAGGACPVVDGYNGPWTDGCLGCPSRGGAGTTGCYLPRDLAGGCDRQQLWWSSSEAGGQRRFNGQWVAEFDTGWIADARKDFSLTDGRPSAYHVRCVYRLR